MSLNSTRLGPKASLPGTVAVLAAAASLVVSAAQAGIARGPAPPSGALRVTVETVGTPDRPTPPGSSQMEIACGPGARTRLTLSPAHPSGTVAVARGARCRVAVRRQPLAPYPCEWAIAYSPADGAGGEGETVAIRYTLICRSGR